MSDIAALIERDLGVGKRRGDWTFWRCPFHDGDDEPSLGVRNGRYYCFACGESGDAVDWLVRFRGLPMRKALWRVKGRDEKREPLALQSPSFSPFERPPEAWAAQAAREVAEAHKRLFSSSYAGEVVRDYLFSRGLTEKTLRVWRLGASADRWSGVIASLDVPMVVIPYLGGGGDVEAVKYRAVLPKVEPRYMLCQGSKPTLYGLWQELKSLLIVIEGEINALSVWQALGGRATVLSCGGQTSRLKLVKVLLLAAKSQGVKTLVWFDDPSVGQGFASLADVVVTSPVVDGAKFDANQMLVYRVLEDFLRQLLERAGVSESVTEERLQPVPAVPKPDGACFACGSTDYWQRPDGGWVCAVCHPQLSWR